MSIYQTKNKLQIIFKTVPSLRNTEKKLLKYHKVTVLVLFSLIYVTGSSKIDRLRSVFPLCIFMTNMKSQYINNSFHKTKLCITQVIAQFIERNAKMFHPQ